jgi:hypothetical protein
VDRWNKKLASMGSDDFEPVDSGPRKTAPRKWLDYYFLHFTDKLFYHSLVRKV